MPLPHATNRGHGQIATGGVNRCARLASVHEAMNFVFQRAAGMYGRRTLYLFDYHPAWLRYGVLTQRPGQRSFFGLRAIGVTVSQTRAYGLLDSSEEGVRLAHTLKRR